MSSEELKDSGAPSPLAAAIYDMSLDCVHCGLCLQSCPTYIATGNEASSPRGRIYLMRGVAEGRVEAGPLLEEEAFLCLGCRACETACPSGVQYGQMVELTREAVVEGGGHADLAARLERGLLRNLVAKRGRLRAALTLLRGVQLLRLDRIAAFFMSGRLRAAVELAPKVPPLRERKPLPERTEAVGERRGRVAFFSGCIMSEVFAETHRATLRVLSQNGFEVLVPASQGCCGALQAHAGDRSTAVELAAHNVEAFGDLSEIDAIVVNSAGCGAALRDVDHWIAANPSASAFAGRVRDVCEFLDEVGLRPPPTRVETRVCYDDPCHLVHAQKVESAPRSLLAAIPGLELVEHAEASACCGAAGTYNITQPEMSAKVLKRKLDALEQANPDCVATGNPGCLMQIASGARSRGLKLRVVHPIELLDAAYR